MQFYWFEIHLLEPKNLAYENFYKNFWAYFYFVAPSF